MKAVAKSNIKKAPDGEKVSFDKEKSLESQRKESQAFGSNIDLQGLILD